MTAPRGPACESSGSAPLLCPSAQPTLAGAVIVGVVEHVGEVPELAYLEEPVPVTEELLALTGPVRPTEVFRFAAPCQEGVCAHWSGRDCQLVERIVDLLPAAALTLPRCAIRGECRWFAQSGGAACRRCPHVVTQDERPSDEMREAATPR